MKKKPKYQVVSDYITDLIHTGQLKNGDQLETEFQLADRLNVSRLTVNKALTKLAQENVIERVAGKGSFVKQPVFTINYKTSGSFTHYMKSQNKEVSSKLEEYQLLDSSEIGVIADYLELKKHDQVHYFAKVRMVDGEAVAEMFSYVPAKIVPDFNISVLSGSLYDYFDSCDLPRLKTKSKFTATLPDQKMINHLNISANTALLRHEHITYTKNETPLEYCIAMYVGNKYVYEMEENMEF